MYDLKEMLCTELDQYARKGGIAKADLEPIEKLTNSIKNITKITEMDEGGYSYGNGNWTANGSYGQMPYDPRYAGRRYSHENNMNRSDYSGDNYDMDNMASRMRRESNY